MNFCKKCGFIYYIKQNLNNIKRYNYYCKNCGYEDTVTKINEYNIYVYENFIIFIIVLLLL